MAGIVTLEDILEEIVREIEDEYDCPEQLIQRIGANGISSTGTRRSTW